MDNYQELQAKYHSDESYTVDLLTNDIKKEAQKDLLERFNDYNHSQTVFDKKLDDFIIRLRSQIGK